MLVVQPIHWGKIRIGDKTTWPPPELEPVLIHSYSGGVVVGYGSGGIAWKNQRGESMPAQDGDIWQEIVRPPKVLLTRK